MYCPMPPDPLPPGPRVTNPIAPLLRLLLRAFNVILAAVALLIIGAALWMGQEYRHRGGDVPPPEPPPTAAQEPLQQPAIGGLLAAMVALGGRSPGWRFYVAPWLQAAMASSPWFLYLVAGTGVYCFLTALCGLAGVKRDRQHQLSLYIALLALLVLAEAGVTLLLLTENSWRERIPDDPSGRWRQAQDWIAANARVARLIAVGTLCVELVVLAAACWLQAIYTAAYEAWIDGVEEQSERTRVALNRTVVETYAGGSGSSWSARLRAKYGVEPSALEATTNAARQAAALQDDLP